MSKQTNEIGYRVIVEPRTMEPFWYRGILGREDGNAKRLKDMKSIAKNIAEQIKRHVDDVASVEVEAETEAVCSHCGGDWTEDGSDYNGGCCAEDEAHNPENATQPA
jgi:hypothetical protein